MNKYLICVCIVAVCRPIKCMVLHAGVGEQYEEEGVSEVMCY